MPGNDRDNLEIGHWQSRVAVLEQLLEVHEQSVVEQSAKLEKVIKELEDRAQRVERSERELLKQTSILQSILDSMGDGVVVTDEKGKFLIFNPAARRIVGIAPSAEAPESWSRHLGVLFLPDAQTPIPLDQLPLARAMRGEVVDEQEVFVRRATASDGIWISVTARPLRDGSGKPRGAVGVLREITERKRAQHELEKKAEQIRDLYNNAPCGYHSVNADSVFILMNDTELNWLGYTRDEVIGRKRFADLLAPQSRPTYEANFRTLRERGSVQGLEFDLVRKDGSTLPVLLNSTAVRDELGRFVMSRSTLFDLTDRRRAERRLSAQHATTQVLAEAKTLNEAASRVVQNLCDCFEWDFGAIWIIDQDQQVLRCAESYMRPRVQAKEFDEKTRTITFAQGVGVPGRVWKTGQRVWLGDLTLDPTFLRAVEAKKAGLRAAFGFPLMLRDEVLGVIEFYNREIERPDDDVLHMMTAIGSQIGQFIERKRAEQSLRESQQRLQSILDNTTAVIYAKDLEGRYLITNRRYEELFHVTRDQARRKTDFDLFPKELAETFRANDQRVLQQLAPIEFEETAPHDDGLHTYISIKFPLLDISGMPYAVCGISTDISDRKATETALQHERYLLSSLMDNVPDAIYFKDRDCRFIRINRALAHRFGLKDPADALGTTDGDYFSAEHARQAYEDEVEVMRTGDPIVAKEERETWEDGRETWVLTTKLPLRDAAGHIVGTFGISRDITRRVIMERALRESEALYHSLVETLPLNVFRKDLAGRFTFANKLYCDTVGRTLNQIIGKTDFDFFPHDLAVKYRNDDLIVIRQGNVFETIEEHQVPHGQRLYVQVIKSPVYDSKGAIVGTQAIFWDVTDRKRAEQAMEASERRYRQFTEAAQDAIVVSNEAGVITVFNAAAQRTFGYSEEEAVGQPVTLLMPREFCEAHMEGFARYLETREPRVVGRTVELRGRRKNGEVFYIDLALTALETPEGLRFLAAIRDTTERHRMQARIVQSEKLASLGLLSAGVAHEINNPLAYVANNLAVLDRDVRGLRQMLAAYAETEAHIKETQPELAKKIAAIAEDIDLQYLNENLQRILDSTRQGVKRVADIVQNLRTFTRVDQATRDRVDIHGCITSSIEMIQGRLTRRNIKVDQKFSKLPPIACAPAQLNQVFLNLLVNAMQAIESSRKPEGSIEVITRSEDSTVVVEIADNGCGIPAEVVPKIFDPFFTTKTIGEGMGLGLSITHGIVRDHNGDIEVESEPGQGTRFRVILPVT